LTCLALAQTAETNFLFRRSWCPGCLARVSRKILRGSIKKIADVDPWTMPATIGDPAILDEIGSALKGHGVGG
jgi:hypothetical protein